MPPITVLIALADPTRCRIIEILRDGPQPVHILAASFKISRPAISRHLRVLKQAKLISEKKLGRENRYALHAEKLKPVGAWVAEMRETTLSEQGGEVNQKPALNKAASKKAVTTVETLLAPVGLPEPRPVIDMTTLTAASKHKRAAAISQMGFDF